MSIRYRLVLIMASLSVLGVCVSSWLAHTRAEANLKDAAIRQLAGLRRARANQIESYFRTVRKHVLSLSDDRMFVEAMREFDGAYGKLDALPGDEKVRGAVRSWYRDSYLPAVSRFIPLTKPAQAYFPVGSAAYYLQNRYVLPRDRAAKSPFDDAFAATYEHVHAKYDGPLRELIDQFGYYDLLLVHPRDLRILYSAAHNPDFGTSLRVGPYHDTPLGDIVTRALGSPDTY
jgi:hypothetical protein